MDLFLFLLSLFLILVSCELFTNGVEWAGVRFNLSEGAVGSVLAAVGTALPETMVPLIAILFHPSANNDGVEIGVGAIMGSPFMIGTLALFVCGLALIIFRRHRGSAAMHVDGSLIRRDLAFFLLAYSLAAIVALLPVEIRWARILLGFSLIPLYCIYIWYTLKTGAVSEEAPEQLYCYHFIKRMAGAKTEKTRQDDPPTWLILAQVLFAIVGIIIGASIFVEQIREIAASLQVSPLILALLIAPLATELPEMYNSFTWVRNGRDIYAIGNLTGAMVFQSCIPVTIGLLLTPWHINIGEPHQALQAVSMGIALLSAAVLFTCSSRKPLRCSNMLFGGLLYAFFIVMVVLTLGGA